MGAASAVEAVLSVKALEDDVIPPTANLQRPDPELGLDLPVEARRSEQTLVINCGYGFGGVNSAVLLGAP